MRSCVTLQQPTVGPRRTVFPRREKSLHPIQTCAHPSEQHLTLDKYRPSDYTREERQRQIDGGRDNTSWFKPSTSQRSSVGTGYWAMTLRVLLATLACLPTAEAFHGAPPAVGAGPPVKRLLAGRNSATQSMATSSFRQQHQQRKRRQPPPPQRACWGDDSAISQRASTSTSTTTTAAASPRASTATTSLSLCNPSLSAASEQDRLLGGETDDGGAGGPMAAKSSSSTLGIAHSVLQRTMVPALSGAVLKQSPSDFVVVELPLYAGTKFTPSDVNAPIPEPVKKPVTRKV